LKIKWMNKGRIIAISTFPGMLRLISTSLCLILCFFCLWKCTGSVALCVKNGETTLAVPC